jgi:polysaccharide export outer membrane protein
MRHRPFGSDGSAPDCERPIAETNAARDGAKGAQLSETNMTRAHRPAWRRGVLLPLWLVCAVGLLAGCESIPTAGPQIGDIIDESAAAKRYGFTLVDVGDGVVRAMSAAPRPSLPTLFSRGGPIVPKIGPGDVLSISIFESGAGELFAPPSASPLGYGTSRITLPNVTVGGTGVIAVPFAGTIKVGGSTPLAAGELIEQRLQGWAARRRSRPAN